MTTRYLPRRARAALVVAIAVALTWCAGAWAVPATLQYQGYLADAAGAPVTGVLRVVFRLYDDADPAVAPTALWEEVHDALPITAGKFAATLGATSSFADVGVTFEEPLFLELEISTETLLPRLPLQSVPYALKAAGVVAGGVTAPMLAAGAVQPGKVHVSLAGNGLTVSATGTLRVATGGITADLLADGSVGDRHVSPTAAIAPAKIAGTAVTLAAEQTLTNKTLDADLNHLLNVDLTEFRPGVVLADLAPATKTEPGAGDQLATAAAIVQFVEGALASQDSLGELADTALGAVSAGDLLVADGAGQWVNRTVSGDLSLDPLGSATIQPDAVALGVDTSGLYVATLAAGAGLSGGGAAEGLAATVAVNVDGSTIQISGDALHVGIIGGANLAADAVSTAHLQDGAVTNAKLAADSVTVSAGSGLAGGGSVALGGNTTLSVADGGIGAEHLAANIDVSAQGFRAAWASDADAVDGAGLADGAAAAGNVLWSSQRVKEYVDGLVLGLDWQNSVASLVSTVPAAPAAGLRVIANGTAGWNLDSIYEFAGAVWVETIPNEGFALWVEDEDRNYVYTGTAWVPLSSTQNHAGLAGLQGGDAETAEYFHLTAALHGALSGLAGNRLLAADAGGLPAATALGDWLAGTADQVTVTADGNGGAVLSLPQDLATTSSPGFAGLELGSGGLTLAGSLITAIGTDPTLAGERSTAVPSEQAVKTYVDSALAGQDTLAELSDVALTGPNSGDLLQFNGSDWVNIAKVPGENIELKADGAIIHGSGLQINLAADGTLVIVGNALGVGVVGTGNIGTDAVALGSQTTGDYVAGITAGAGLSGEGSGEGSAPTLAINVDNQTLVISDDALQVADGGISTLQVAAGAITNAKLENPGLTVSAGSGLNGGGNVSLGGTVSLGVAAAGITTAHLQDGAVTNAKLADASLKVVAGTGLAGGGSVALGGSVTLGVAAGGIGAAQIAAGTDVSAKGFRAAWAADADAVDGAGLADGAAAAGNVLWSSQRIKEYVDGLAMGLDWQDAVASIVTSVPTAPLTDSRVIADHVPGWTHSSIYHYDGVLWHEMVPHEGWAVWVMDQDMNYVFNGTDWVPISSTQNHAGLAGLQGGDAETAEYFHLTAALHGALSGLAGNRLLAADAGGLPAATALGDWLAGTADQVTVTADGNGGAVLSLPQDLATSSSPGFAGLELGSGGLTLAGSLITAIGTDPTLAGERSTAVPSEQAVKTYVDSALAGQDTLAELSDVALTGPNSGDLLQFNGSDWVNIAKVPGENIELKADGAIIHGSGLQINLAADGTLVIVGNALGVGVVGTGNIGTDAVALGSQTTGDYVAGITAGAGLSGEGSGEGSAPTLAINVDNQTLVISDDALQVADGGISTLQVAAGAITNAKLENPALTVSAGTGLAGGGSVALGGNTTLSVADGGIGAGHLAANIDVSAQGFRAAWAADADAVDGAGLADGAVAAGNVLWSSQRVKEYVDALVYGLDWQQSVKFITVIVPAAPAIGLRVISDAVPGWVDNSIYEYDGAFWRETAANEGFAAWIEDQDRNFVFNGTEWVPLSSTQNHAGLAGLQGGDAETAEYFHLTAALHGALSGLAGNRLLAADAGGLPAATALGDWLAGTADQVTVTATGGGGAVLSLPQDLATSSSPGFAGLELGSGGLTLAGSLITAIGTDPTLAGERSTAVPSEQAVKTYVDSALAGQDTLAELSDVALTGPNSGDLLQFNGSDWVNIAKVPGENIELKADGAIIHGSGLQINLAADGTLVIAGNALGVGVVGTGNIGTDAVALGTQTTGDYVAGITAGAGLSGDASGEGSAPTLAVNVDNQTLVISDDVLEVADGGISTLQVAAGAITNAKLENPALTVSAGTGLAGGGSVALGGNTTLSVADGGIGAGHLAANIDVSAQGFRAAWAADADAVDGAGLADGAVAAGNVLWSSQRVKEYVDALVYGLDWQQSVKFITVIVPAAPAIGLRVISDAVPGWVDNSIYEYDGAFWRETAANEGFAAWIEDQDRNFVFNGIEWVPLSSTQDHAGLAGLQGGDVANQEFYHLAQPLFNALTALPAKRLLETTSAGLPTAAALDTWISSAAAGLGIAPRGDGGVVLDLGPTVPQGSPTKDYILMGNGTDWVRVPQTDIVQLGTITMGTWNGAPIDGAYIDLAPDGGLTHGSGLKLNLDGADPALRIDGGNVLRIGELDSSHIQDESLTGNDIEDGSLSGDDILDGSLFGGDLAPSSVGIDRLLGIIGIGKHGQTVLADGVGGFRLGSELPLYLNHGTAAWDAVRIVPTGTGSAPWGVAQDPSGKLYVADATGHCIRVFTGNGEYLGWYGESGGDLGYVGYHPGSDPDTPQAGDAVGAFDTPRAVAVMSVPGYAIIGGKGTTANEFLWVADSANNRIQRLDLSAASGAALEYPGEAFDEYGLVNPSGIAVLDQNLYIADTGNHRVIAASYYSRYFMVDGWYGSADGGSGGYHAMGAGASLPTSGVWNLQFNTPMHLAVEFPAASSYAVLAVADSGNGRAALVNLSLGSMLGWIGADDEGGSGWHDAVSEGPSPVPGDGDGAFRAPYGVAFGGYGLAVSDAEANVLQFYRYSPGGFVGSFGVTGSDPGQFITPTGLASAIDGALWVCDTGNYRLQKLQAPHGGTYTVVPWESGPVIIGGDTPEPSAALQIDSSSGGLLVPRYDDVSQLYGRIADPAEGLLAFCYGTQIGEGKSSQASDQGFYFWNGSAWEQLGKPPLDYYGGLEYDYADEIRVKLDYYGGLDFNGAGEVMVKLASGGGLMFDSSYSSYPYYGLKVDWAANPFLPKAGSAVQAGPSGAFEVQDSAGLQSALTATLGASAEVPAVIRLAPGVYTTPLTLNSHVDIEGSGVGKTILRVQGGTAVTAAAVVNAGLRQLTIEVVGQGGAADLVGLQYGGAAESAGLRLLNVDVRILGAVPGRGAGIRCGQSDGGATSGLRLEHVRVEATAAAAGGIVALEVSGSADVLDCDFHAGNRVGAAVGVLVDPHGLETASFRQVTVNVGAAARESLACRVRGAGAVLLKGCTLSAAGGPDGSVLAVSGESADRQARVRIEETSLRLLASAGPATAKARIGSYGRLDAFSAQMLGGGAALVIDKAGRLAASYCLMEGHCPLGATARYTYCSTVDPQTGDGVPMARSRANPR